MRQLRDLLGLKEFASVFSSVQFISVQFKMTYVYELGKSHMCSTPFLRRFTSVAFETVPVFVCVCLIDDGPFRPLKEYLPELPLFYTSLLYEIDGVMSTALSLQVVS